MKITRKDFLLRSGAAALPLSLAGAGAALAAEPTQPSPTQSGQPHFNVRQFGAIGDGKAKDTNAIQSAIDAAGKNGGVVYLPPGKYLSGTVRLKSHVSVFIDAGATLISSPDKDDFDPYEKLDFKSFSDDETTDFHYALLRGQDVEHVGVFGPGTIEGNRTKRGGPKPIALKNCRHIAVRDITLQNSPNYNISLLGCDHVNIEGVTILNGYCDGIDPDCCHHVRIANCYVESWDDAIVPKASFALGYRRSTENVAVTNCVLTTACNAFKLGTESSGDFKNISVGNCTMYGRPDLWKRNPTSGVSIEMVDGASIDRVVVSNIAMADIRAPIFIRQGARGRAQKVPKPEVLQNVSISDVVATGAQLTSSISGIPGYPVHKITLKNIHISARGSAAADLADRVVPEQENGYPDAGRFGELPAYGLYCRHVETLMLDNISLHLEQTDGRPALIAEDVAELDLRSITADPPSSTQPALWLRDVRSAFLQGSRARAGTRTFVKLSGEKTARIRAIGNDFGEAEKEFLLAKEVSEKEFRQEGNLSAGR
ncbi:MAG: right-handed parallel beta-helix repeat-containing protein [Verrucomicrobia bacterium]|nr:right-handed parallel beta-helix repeat-containing protein [Verrucomicrobiota bacterium]